MGTVPRAKGVWRKRRLAQKVFGVKGVVEWLVGVKVVWC